MGAWFEFRAVGLDFLDEAPLRVEVAVETTLSRQQVWAFFIDASGWSAWFPGVERSGYGEEGRPPGVGTQRTASVNGVRFEETILAWDEPARWIYRIDRCTGELATAQVEATLLEETSDGGTRVVWILACDPLPPMASAADVLPSVLEGQLAQAVRQIERLVSDGVVPRIQGGSR